MFREIQRTKESVESQEGEVREMRGGVLFKVHIVTSIYLPYVTKLKNNKTNEAGKMP